jgi:hypothetical protein
MAEIGCLKDGCFQNLQVEGNVVVTSQMTSHYLNYITGDPFGLTVQALSDANVDAAAGSADNDMVANKFVQSDYDAGAAGNITLPAATKDAVIIYEQGEEADGGNVALTATCSGDDTFVAGCHIHAGTGAANQNDTSVATDVSLAITFTGTNDTWGGVGSQLCFYSPLAGKWMVRFGRVVPTGTGAPGTQIAFA